MCLTSCFITVSLTSTYLRDLCKRPPLRREDRLPGLDLRLFWKRRTAIINIISIMLSTIIISSSSIIVVMIMVMVRTFVILSLSDLIGGLSA